MNVASRPAPSGKTRTCPHCKAVVLESLSVCPGCLHHLRFDAEAAKRQVAATTALRVDGVIRHPAAEEAWEYFVVIAIRNDRGEELDRKVVNVGALQGADRRTVSLSVEVLPPRAPDEPPARERPEPGGRPEAVPAAARSPAAALTPPNGPSPAPASSSASGPAQAPPAGGIRLPDGTLLKPPGTGPKRK
jgi:hypothetical protein